MHTTESRARYVRAWIDLKLVVRSPLHVGSGHTALLKERVPEYRKGLRKHLAAEDGEPTYRPMTLRKTKCEMSSGAVECERACIPGSTIKGALRAALQPGLSAEHVVELFGPRDESAGREKPDRRIGRIRFSDSRSLQSPDFEEPSIPPLWEWKRGTGVRARVAIDPITGAAARHQLTFHEFVPESSQFTFHGSSRFCVG